MKNLSYLLLITLLFLNACSKDESSSPSESEDWLIPANQVQSGGPGKDGIPSIDNPRFITVNEVSFLDDTDLVIGVAYDNEFRAYPHPILDWHEIVNDEFATRKISLTYCPLTGTAISWNRIVNGTENEFGVSGKLYNNNLMPYDRVTDSYWSQQSLTCVNGELIGAKAETFPVIETTWKTWKAMYPNSMILSTNTGFNRNYNQYPYGDYITNNNRIIFPLNPSDNRLPSKERVLGVLTDQKNKAYSINSFEEPKAIIDVVGESELLIVGSKTENFIVAFDNDSFDDFTVDLSNLPIIGSDAAGNQLDITGKIVAGPLVNTQLTQPTNFMGYWFSFGAFYNDIDIYNE